MLVRIFHGWDVDIRELLVKKLADQGGFANSTAAEHDKSIFPNFEATPRGHVFPDFLLDHGVG